MAAPPALGAPAAVDHSDSNDDFTFDDAEPQNHRGEDFVPSVTFADLGVDDDLVAALEAGGIMSPFPVQAATIPDALAGRDLCGRAPTGSGKTLAFGIPMMSRISRAEGPHPTGVILVPTRELATQVRDELVELGKVRKRYILAVYGGVPYSHQLNALNRGAALIVACPGRLLDLIEKGAVSLDKVEVAVIDEADRMADLGFMPDVRKLMSMMPNQRQTLLFSATLDGDVDELIARHQKDPVRHDLVGEDLGPAAVHKFEMHDKEARLNRAADLIKEHGPTMLFTMTREGSDELADMLFDCGIRAVAIHGGRSQQQRERALKSFKTGRVQALVGTDVAARGIHVDGVNLVIHWDTSTVRAVPLALAMAAS
jgi:superfamily II DNA/RNA helicase